MVLILGLLLILLRDSLTEVIRTITTISDSTIMNGDVISLAITDTKKFFILLAHITGK